MQAFVQVTQLVSVMMITMVTTVVVIINTDVMIQQLYLKKIILFLLSMEMNAIILFSPV